MKNLEGKTIAKKIIAIFLVIVTILSTFPLSVFAGITDGVTVEDVVFNASWHGVEGDTVSGTTKESFSLDYRFTLSNSTTGFQNVKMIVETETLGIDGANDTITVNVSQGSNAQSSSGRNYVIIDFGNVNEGTSIGGQVSVNFKNNGIEERKIKLTLQGKYGDNKIINEVKIFKANITPAPVITQYDTSIGWQTYKSYGTTYTRWPSVNLTKENLLGEEVFGTQDLVVGYYTTSARIKYPIHITTGEKTQKIKLIIKINRTNNNNESRLSDGYTIDWNGLNTLLGEPTQSQDTSDGSAIYTFVKELNSTDYDSNTAFKFDREFDIYVTYDTSAMNPKTNASLTSKEMKMKASFEATLNGKGFKITKEYGQPENAQLITINERKVTDYENETLYSYTPGANAWIQAKLDGSLKVGDETQYYINRELIDTMKEEGKLDININADISYVRGAYSQNTGSIVFDAPTLRYTEDDTNVSKKITLTDNQIKVKSIKENNDKYDAYYEVDGTSAEINGTYNVTDGKNAFSLKLVDYLKLPDGAVTKSSRYTVKYELDVNELGLSDTELESISSIEFSIHQGDGSGNAYISATDSHTFNKAIETVETDNSFMELVLGDNFSSEVSEVGAKLKTLTIKMYKPDNILRDTSYTKNYIVNKNPIFYISLPGSYNGEMLYEDFNITTTNSALTVDEDNLDLITVDGEDYLVVPCIGEYNSRNINEIDLTVQYNRTLQNPVIGGKEIEVYMITDNERYYYSYNNLNSFKNSQGIATDKVFKTSTIFNIVGNNIISAKTEISRENDDKRYKPNTSDGINNDYTELEKPLITGSGKKVTYNAKVTSSGETLKDVRIFARLPKKDNTFINISNNSTKQLIEEDFQLPEAFYAEYGEYLNGNAQGSAVIQKDLTGLNVLGLYLEEANGREVAIDSSKYKIYSTPDANATFDSGSFVEYVAGTTEEEQEAAAAQLAAAKNIKAVITDSNFKLQSGESLVLKYEMTMPDEACMVGAQTAVNYKLADSNEENTLYSPAAYVINGSGNKLKIQKKFENYPIGQIPTPYGITSYANIEFKLQYYNEATGEREFLKDNSNNDLTATTDANGIAIFENIPAGRYFLYETTTFENYAGISGAEIINMPTIGTKEYTAVNKLKRGNVTINKVWQGSTVSQGQVQLKLIRVNANNEQMNVSPIVITTNADDQAFALNVPYGTYSVTEYKGVTGWIPQDMNKRIVLLNGGEEVTDGNLTTTYVNIPINNITLELTKTVPLHETVKDLSFEIIGRSILEDQENITFDPNVNITVKIVFENETPTVVVTNNKTGNVVNDYEATIETSEENKKAVIRINNLYAGYYSINEVEIPTIGETGITKYPGVGDTANLLTPASTVKVDLINNHKYGKIVINKTAKLKDGTDYYTISDLTGFQVNVKGHSFYNQEDEIDETIILDEDGYGELEVEIGTYTITEVPVEGYTTYYGTSSSASQTPPEITITENNSVYTQDIYNEHTGVGYIKIQKTMEGISDAQEIANKGIKFVVSGRNIAGEEIDEKDPTKKIEGVKGVVIEINQVDTDNNIAYGISGPISVGGEYELNEVDSTVPDYYEQYEPTEVSLNTSYTLDSPKVVEVTNNKSRGDLEIITTTEPEGGPLTGITYKVTPVKINSNATYTVTGESQTVEGSNETTNPSFAKLENIYAGFYAVEQVTVPEGWKADVKQIVEVPSNNTGYANFEITKKIQIRDNKVIIRKELLDENDEIATDEYIEEAELNADESFEVKLTNVNTNEDYYVFVSATNPGVITGLDVGTYRIEEVYKPKYKTEGYFKEITMLDENSVPQPTKVPLTLTNNTFTITEEEGTIKDVTLVVVNKINKEFGFGGQKSINNLSTIVVEEQQDIFVTKAVIYVTDEQNKAISGVKFKLFDAQNNQISLNNLGSEFEINEGKLIIKGLPVGKYTLKCTQFPEGYLKPDDKEVIVYSDATQVVRVEVQKNIPRGSLTLATVFNKKNGDTRYVTRSEYKVVNSATGELVKFVRTPAGKYKKSNTAEASPIVTLKAAPVELQGLELGDYEVGIVGVRKGYGITKDDPEYVTVEENSNRKVVTTVEDKSIVKVDAHGATTAYLDSNGDLYYIGYLYNTSVYNRDKFTKLYFGENVKIKDFSYITYSGTIRLLAVDEDGHVWAYGPGNTPQLGVMNVKYTNGSTDSAIPPICITKDGDLRDAYASGARFVEAQLCGYYSSTLLDNQGRVWIMGTGCDGNGNMSTAFVKPIQPFIDNNVKIAKLARNGTTYLTNYGMGCIDTDGKVWIWGGYTYPINTEYNVYAPKCLSDTTDLGNVKIVDLVIRDTVAMALDENGEVWIWGTNDTLQKIVQGGTSTTTPTKIPKSYFQGEKVVGIDLNNGYSDNKIAAVITESGKVFTWGYQSKGELGVGSPSSMSIPAPSCLSTGTQKLSGVKITQICIGAGNSNNYPNGANGYTCHVVALDSNNGMWAWGGYSLANEAGQPITTGISAVAYPQRMYTTYDEHLEYNLKFESIAGISTGTSATNYAIDSEGRVWVWGYNASCQLGIQPESTTVVTPTVLEIPGNPKMKKVYNNNYYKAIFLSEDGRVFASGNQVYNGNGSQSLTSSNPLTEITDSCPAGITDIYIWDATIVALDEAGQVWTWGGSGGPSGRSTSQATKQVILSDKNIVKISGGSNGALALSSDGKLYAWKDTNSPSLIVSSKDFVDICGLYAIDSEGHLWYCSGYQLVEVDKVTEKMQEDSEYKIEKMLLDLYSYGNQLVYKDSNEDIWSVSGNGTPTKMNFGISGIKALNPSTILTEDGQLWSYNNSTYETNNMMSDFKSKNLFYGKKFKHLYSNSYVSDDTGKMYDTSSKTEIEQPSAQTYMKNMKAYIEEVKGKHVIQAYPYCVLDEDYHVWYTSSSSEYPTDFCAEGNALYGVNVQKIYKQPDTETYFAIDSEGKLWAWGNNYYGYLGNGTTTSSATPVRVGTLTGITDVYASLKTSSSGSQCVIAREGNGNLWAWGRDEGGLLGTSGIVSTPRQMTISGKNIIADKLNYKSNNSYVLCDDGSVYKANGTSGFQLIGTCEGATKILDSRINTNDNGRVITGSNKTWIVSGTTVTEVGNFEAVDAYFYEKNGSYYGFIDTQGRYWTNESGSYAIDESVQQAGGIIRANYGRESSLIDSNGHTHGYLDIDLSSIIKDMYGVVNAENAAKYANDLVSSPSSSNITRTKIINGQLWTYTFTPQGRIISYTNYAEWPDSDMVGKTIVEFTEATYSENFAIDSEGELYSLKTAKSLNRNEYNVTPAPFPANNNVINSVKKNPVYGTKFKDVSNDIFATDVNDNVWYFPVGGTVKNISKELKGTLNPLYGKQIKKMVATNYLVTTDNKLWYVGGDVPKYVMDTVNDDECTILYSNYYQGSECVIGIDNAGKIYVAGVGNRTGLESRTTNGKVVCLNDVEGSPLNGVSLTTKAIDSSSNFVIIDTNGKVWMWGSSLATPTCITDKSTSAVHTAYENGVTMVDFVSYLGASAVKYTYLSDSTGELWTISSTDITKLSEGTLIGKTAEEKIVDITEAARLTSNGTLYVRYTPQVTIGGTNYAASTTKYRNVNELVTNVTIPQVTEIFDGYVPYASNTVTIANTVDGMYEITIKYNSSSPYGNYTIEARKLSTATVVKYFNAYGTYRYHHIYLDSNGDLWVSGYMGRLFNNTNTYEYGDYKMKCITTDSRSPLYNKKFTNVEKHGTALLGTTTTGELYFIEEYYTSYDTSPKLLDNDEVVAQVYGQENVDDAHKIKLFDEPGIVYSNGKFFNVQYGIRATETEKNWLQHYYDGIGIITEVVGEYDVKNSDGEIYRLTPTGIDTVTYEKVTESIPFSTATPDEAIDVPGATIVKQVKHKALDSKGNLYVWDTHTGLVDETEGVVCLTDTVNSIGPVYNEGNGWTVIQGSNY